MAISILGIRPAAAVLVACIGLSLLTSPTRADEIPALAGTKWLSEAEHTRVTIDHQGEVELKTGKHLYIEFLTEADGVYAIKVNWWNVEKGINVVEHAILLPETRDTFIYVEADHPEDSDFPGIIGHGNFFLIDDSTAEITQAGHLTDGSASGFVTRLKKVDEAPVVPIPQTYPKQNQPGD